MDGWTLFLLVSSGYTVLASLALFVRNGHDLMLGTATFSALTFYLALVKLLGVESA